MELRDFVKHVRVQRGMVMLSLSDAHHAWIDTPDGELWDACWEWQGTRRRDGYGLVYVDGVQQRAHRVSYELSIGPIPPGLSVLHVCDNPPCVRPSHLRVGTQRDNLADMTAKGRRFSPFTGQVQIGSLNRNAKLNADRVRWIREATAAGLSQTAIASALGVDRATIRHVILGKTWKHVL